MDNSERDLQLALKILEEVKRIIPDLPDDEDFGLAFPNGMSVAELVKRLRAIPDGAGRAAIQESLHFPPGA